MAPMSTGGVSSKAAAISHRPKGQRRGWRSEGGGEEEQTPFSLEGATGERTPDHLSARVRLISGKFSTCRPETKLDFSEKKNEFVESQQKMEQFCYIKGK